jgi:hypothetical protein
MHHRPLARAEHQKSRNKPEQLGGMTSLILVAASLQALPLRRNWL